MMMTLSPSVEHISRATRFDFILQKFKNSAKFALMLLGWISAIHPIRLISANLRRPQVIIRTNDVQTIKGHLIAAFVKSGATLENDTENQISFLLPNDKISVQLLVGSNASNRFRFTFVKQADTVLVIGNEELISRDPNFSRPIEITNPKELAFMQKLLDTIKNNIENDDPNAGRLGVDVREMEKKEIRSLTKKWTQYEGGVWITSIYPDLPAAAAGLKSGDVMLEINDQHLINVATFVNIMHGKKAGDQITLKYLRDGSIQDLSIVLAGKVSTRNGVGGEPQSSGQPVSSSASAPIPVPAAPPVGGTCSIAQVGMCGGCSIACELGKAATCNPGVSTEAGCEINASCTCK